MNWIRVEDSMPEKNGRYLVAEYNNGFNCPWIGVSSLREGRFDGGKAVKFWMNLPEAPK